MAEDQGTSGDYGLGGQSQAAGGAAREQRRLSFEDFAKRASALNAESFKNGLTSYHFIVNDEEFYKQMENTVGKRAMIDAMTQEAEHKFVPQMKPLLKNIIEESARGLPDGAWPFEYTDHVKNAIERMPDPKVDKIESTGIFLEMEILEYYLGNEDDFALAFHHGALKKGANLKDIQESDRIDVRRESIGTDVSSLMVQDPIRRSVYWNALQKGKKSFTTRHFAYDSFGDPIEDDEGNPKTKKVKIKVSGSWRETVKARMAAWDKVGKAPEWTMLEDGQLFWNPEIHPIAPKAITRQWFGALRAAWTEAIVNAWDYQIEQLINAGTAAYSGAAPAPKYTQSFTRAGRSYGVTRDARGRFTGGGYI